jgi:hypothetical protein
MRRDILRLFLTPVIFALAMLSTYGTLAAGLSEISNQDAVAGLKEALSKGSQAAIQQLGAENGFFGNDKLRIPLPDSLKKVEGMMRRFGMGNQADELVLRMNRAAEAAMPEARALLVNAIRQMSIQDAKGILTGGDDAATQYFRRTTSTPLTQKFLPIVKKATEKVKLAERYSTFVETGSRFGLVKEEEANLENYVTRKALDGLYSVIAEQEKKIRADPVGAASSIISKVFGALRK